MGRLYEHCCKLCNCHMSVAHILFDCVDIDDYRNMQWQFMEVPSPLKESLTKMSTQQRSAVMCNALNVKYEKDWVELYSSIANFIVNVTNFYDNQCSSLTKADVCV